MLLNMFYYKTGKGDKFIIKKSVLFEGRKLDNKKEKITYGLVLNIFFLIKVLVIKIYFITVFVSVYECKKKNKKKHAD